MKMFNETEKFAVVKDNMGIDITELEKLRNIKENISDTELRKKIDEKLKEAEKEYVERALSLNIEEENKKEKEKECDEALKIVDAVASTFKKVVVWAYNKH